MSKIIKLLINGRERAILCMFTLAHGFTFEFCTATIHFIIHIDFWYLNKCTNMCTYMCVLTFHTHLHECMYEVCANLISYWLLLHQYHTYATYSGHNNSIAINWVQHVCAYMILKL